MRAILMLEDGKIFSGETDYPIAEKYGEVFFDTRVVGYQEAITDPANAKRIMVFTYPLIGNYGIAKKFNESERVWPAAVVIKEKSRIFSNWQAEVSLDEWAREKNLSIIYGIDTRILALYIRQKGEMAGAVTSNLAKQGDLLDKIKEFKKASRQNLLEETSVKAIKHLLKPNKNRRIAILDLGITKSILEQIKALNYEIVLLPYNTKSEDILRLKPKALIISGGPEIGSGLDMVASNIREIISRIPILGISTGAEVLASGLGAKVKRMPLGHHGLNYPIKSAESGKGEITVQNHSYVIEGKSLKKIKSIKITANNLNDNTIEEFESKELKILGVQYYPLSPGFGQMHPVFRRFISSWLI